MSTPGAELNLALKVTADTQAGVANLGQVATTNDQIAQAATRAAEALTRLATSAEGLAAIATASGEAGVAQATLAEAAATTTTALASEGETADAATARIKAMVSASLEAAAAQTEHASATTAAVAATAATTRATDAQSASYARAMAAAQRSGAAVSRHVWEIAALEAALKRGAKSMDELAAIESQIDSLMRRGALSTTEQTAALQRLNEIEAKLAAQRRANGTGAGGPRNESSGNPSSGSGHAGGFGSSAAIREYGVLGGELARGNTARFEGSLITLANRTGLIASVFTATGITITSVTALVAGFAAAALAAAEDETKFNDAIAVTGNNVGQTYGSFEQLASGITGANAKLSTSRQIIEQLAASGKVGQQSLASVAQAAADIGELTGANAEKASQEALRYFDGTTAGAMRANDQFHFLTTAVYDQIKALEDAGDVQAAQDVAARAFHEAAIVRIDDVREHVTGLTKVWRGLGTEVSDAWERMKLGASLITGTAGDQTELYALLGRQASAQKGDYSTFGRTLNTFLGAGLVDHIPGAKESFSADDQARLQELQTRIAQEETRADQAAQNSRLNDAALKANAAIDKRQEQYDKPTARQHAIDQLDAEFLAAWNDPNANSNPRLKGVTNYVDTQGKVQFSGGMYDQQKADIEKHFTDRAAGAADRADLSAQTAQARQQLQLYTDAFTNAERVLDTARKAGTVSDSDYWTAKRKNIDDLESKQVAELDREKAAIAGHGNTAAERIRIDQQVQGIEAQIAKAHADASAKRAVLDDQEHQATEKKIDDANRLQEAYLRATGQDGEAAALRIRDQYAKALREANLNGDNASAAKIKVIIDVETAKAQLSALRSDISTTQADQQRQEQDIQARLQAGQLSQIEAQRQLFDLHKQTYEAITAELPKLQELADATADPKVIEQVQQLRSEMNRLGLETDQITTSVRNNFQSSFDDVFNSLGTRINNARDLFYTLIGDVARGLQRIASQQLSELLTNKLSGVTSRLSQLLGGTGETIADSAGATTAAAITTAGTSAAGSIGTAGASISTAIVDAGTIAANAIAAAAAGSAAGGSSSGWLGAIGSMFGSRSTAGAAANGSSYRFDFAADAAASTGYDTGGYTGDSPWTQVAGVVHGGEHVTRAAVVAQPGVRAMLDDLNTYGVAGLSKHVPGFAGGGYVDLLEHAPGAPSIAAPPTPALGSKPGSSVVNNRMRIYNLFDIDDLVKKLVSHPEMEKMVVVKASENGQAIQAEWGA